MLWASCIKWRRVEQLFRTLNQVLSMLCILTSIQVLHPKHWSKMWENARKHWISNILMFFSRHYHIWFDIWPIFDSVFDSRSSNSTTIHQIYFRLRLDLGQRHLVFESGPRFAKIWLTVFERKKQCSRGQHPNEQKYFLTE